MYKSINVKVCKQSGSKMPSICGVLSWLFNYCYRFHIQVVFGVIAAQALSNFSCRVVANF